MNIYQGKYLLQVRLILSLCLVLVVSCDELQEPLFQDQDKKQSGQRGAKDNSADLTSISHKKYVAVNDDDYDTVIRFQKTGVIVINLQEIALGDPIGSWINVLGKESRVTRNRGYIWDEMGISLSLDEDDPKSDSVDQISISFADYYEEWPEKKERYPDGPPHGVFTGLIRFGDAWIDRDRQVKEFLDYESTSTLKDSYDRSLVFRDIFKNENGEIVSFSITQGLSKDFPEGPNHVTANIIH